MRTTRTAAIMLALLLIANLVGGVSPAAAAPVAAPLEQATVSVTLSDMGLEFGAITVWEASLYRDATPGNETGGRFTAWIAHSNGVVTFNLPADILAGQTAPWGVPDDTYVRVRAAGEGVYPTFDLVSDPFTLTSDSFAVHFAIESVNEAMPPVESETATVMARLVDTGGAFGAPGMWEASLYRNATPGNETGGRFTAWVPAMDGVVTFNLPDDISAGQTAPWDVPDDTYIRVRSVGAGAYPTFDLVGRPFTLTDGLILTSSIVLIREPVPPTAVTLVALEAQVATSGSVSAWGAVVASLIVAAGAIGVRRRTRVR